jgi:hypothetical protein
MKPSVPTQFFGMALTHKQINQILVVTAALPYAPIQTNYEKNGTTTIRIMISLHQVTKLTSATTGKYLSFSLGKVNFC